jgi:hypothetical protein
VSGPIKKDEMRGSGTHPPTAALFPSPIHAKFSDLRKLRKALCERAFNSYKLKIHPHDFKKTQKIKWTATTELPKRHGLR